MKFYTSFHQYGSKVLLRGYEFGNRVEKKLHYEPTLYIPHTSEVKEKDKFKTLDGTPVYPIKFDSMREARDFIKKYDDIENFKIYGSTNFAYCCINETYKGQIEYDPSLVAIVCLDIETDSSNGFPNISTADKAITAITMRRGSSIVTMGLKDYTPHAEKITYYKCEGEHELLEKFLELWNSRTYSADVLTGWNIELFDLPYIVNRIKRLLGDERAKELSPWRLLEEREIESRGKTLNVNFPVGIAVLDYMRLYKKFSFKNQESYALNFIADADLGEKKVDYNSAGYKTLDELYQKNHQLYIEYNIHDVNLVYKLEDKHRFIEQVMAMAYDAKVNYVDTMATVRPWDTIIHNYLLEQNVVIPQGTRPNSMSNVDIVGGFVKEPKPGMYDWVVSFDLTSLYPHLIMQYNISPETYRGKIRKTFSVDEVISGAYDEEVQEYMKTNDVNVCPNSCVYSREKQGFLPALMQKMFDDRKKYKDLMLEAKERYEQTKDPEWSKKISAYHNMQLAKKIQLNSAYGALANKYFRWYSADNAEAITTSGQLSIKWIEKMINEYLNFLFKTETDYVIAIDTDSMYLDLSGLVKQVFTDKGKTPDKAEVVAFLDRACRGKIEPYIAKCYDDLGTYVNAYQQKMHMKRESIADKGVWTGKKHYVMQVYNEEGVAYSTPKMKMVGIEAVRSSTPKVCRENIKKALTILMNEGRDALKDYIEEFREQWNKLSFEEVAFPRGVKMTYFRHVNGSNVPFRYDLTTKGLPIQVRAALVYNTLLTSRGLSNTYQLINDEEKIRFCYLKKPNPLGHNVIASTGQLPPELGLDKYIDYDTQFEKAFVEPIKSITDVLGWNLDGEVSTLESFFG